MPSSIYCISLNPSVDYTFYLNDIVDEDINRIEKSIIHPGGKGMNVARMLKKLGEDVFPITFISKKETLYRKLLKKEKIDFIPIEINGKERNVYNYISKKRVLRFNEKGPEIKKQELKKFFNVLSNLKIKKKDIVVMSGSIPPGIKEDIYAKIVKRVKKFDVFTVVDADGEILKKSIKEKPFIIKPNLKELERTFNTKIENYEKIKEICFSLIKSGISIILVTNGKNGALLFTEKEIIYSKPPQVNFKSNIGCGDAFLSGFLCKFKNGEKYEDALKFAVSVGAAKAEEEGTKMPSFSKIKKLLNSVKIWKNPDSIDSFFTPL
ncbi:MAG: 1-phosphofructokinase family hexose kinase [Candidatus Omnitrophica bacterium]|nr:1-phosphofructokinase family hexose kinase [Candidatus Omnitrophota bacterium]